MKLKSPPAVLDTRFEAFLQLLPEDYWQTAYDFQSFARARKIRSSQHLLQLLMLNCGLDLSLRSCTGEIAHLQDYLSDMGVKKDCTPVFRGSKPCWHVCLA